MNLIFREKAWDQYLHWQASDAKTAGKLNSLIRECLRHPYDGTGKPEPLTGDLSGFWSRRIDREHRLVYRASDTTLEIHQCRYHY